MTCLFKGYALMSSSRMHSLHTNQKMEFIKKNEEKERHDFEVLNLLMQNSTCVFLVRFLEKNTNEIFLQSNDNDEDDELDGA